MQTMEPTALLILVHGSPRPIANEEMYRVVGLLRERRAYPIIEVGFMECNTPTIPESVDACVEQGAKTIIAVPYFLHTGTHVASDLPDLLEEARQKYPDVEFRYGDYLGRSEILTDVLERRILEAFGAFA